MEQKARHETADRDGTTLHNGSRIQQVLEIEKQAQAIHDTAVRDAEQYPQRAEQEAQALIAKAKTDAEEEARQLIARAQSQEDAERILAQAQEEAKRMETLAATNIDRAVAFVLDRVAGRE